MLFNYLFGINIESDNCSIQNFQKLFDLTYEYTNEYNNILKSNTNY